MPRRYLRYAVRLNSGVRLRSQNLGNLIGIIGLIWFVVEFGFWNVVFFVIFSAVVIVIVAAAFPQHAQANSTPKRPRKLRNSNIKTTYSPVIASTQGEFGHIRTGLVIDEPWVSKITHGEKIWEMRSTATKKRERIALIKKGSASVVGIATISDVLGPLNDRQISDTFQNHQVPTLMIGKWRYAWVLQDIAKLDQPVRYIHKNGAVTFVTLDVAASQLVSAADRAAA